MNYKEKFLETINKIAEEEHNKVKINKCYIDVLENQDKVIESKNKVIIELLKRIAILEREVEEHEGF